LGAQPGDVVKIAIRSQDLFKGAAVLYLVPAAALLIGAMAGGWLAGRMGWTATSGNVLGAIAGIMAAVLFLIVMDRSRSARRRFSPTVVEILTSGKQLSDKHASMMATAHHGCCG
jgi:positive regulator of sigma E activity